MNKITKNTKFKRKEYLKYFTSAYDYRNFEKDYNRIKRNTKRMTNILRRYTKKYITFNEMIEKGSNIRKDNLN